MIALDTIVKAAIPLIQLLIKGANQSARRAKHIESIGADDVEEGLQKHLAFIVHWCLDISIREMGEPRELEDLYVETELISARFPKRRVKVVDLMRAKRCSLVLGPLGAGKTTTVKAIAHHLITSEETDTYDTYQFPLVIRCRDVGARQTLSQHVLGNLQIIVNTSSEGSKTEDVQRAAQALREQIVGKLLTDLGAMLLIDGFDELPAGPTVEYAKEIDRLAALAGNRGILVTCRSGAIQIKFDSFDTISVREFSQSQLRSYARRFLGSKKMASGFLAKLHDRPYASLALTPLHAANLCRIFQAEGDLPPENIRVYSKIVQVRTRDWDMERGVTRLSQFEDFGSEQKRKLLSAIAFHLAKEGLDLSSAHATSKVPTKPTASFIVCPATARETSYRK